MVRAAEDWSGEPVRRELEKKLKGQRGRESLVIQLSSEETVSQLMSNKRGSLRLCNHGSINEIHC